MSEIKCEDRQSFEESSEPAIIVKPDNSLVVNEAFAEREDVSKRRLDGGRTEDLLANVTSTSGTRFVEVLDRGLSGGSWCDVRERKGQQKMYRLKPEHFDHQGASYLCVTASHVPEPDFEADEEEIIEQYSHDATTRAASNIRLDGPQSTLTLTEVMVDVASTHSELEQIRDGAVNLYARVLSRLEEERQRNPDSMEVAVLQSAAREAYRVAMRVRDTDEIKEE